MGLIDEAWNVVGSAASKASIEVKELSSLEGLREVAGLYASVWSREGGDPIMPAELLRALSHAGNYVTGAFSDGRLVGALAGFLGLAGSDLRLHSHILGVLPDVQGKNVGFVLKQHQRAWCLERGISVVSWTFDPLVAKNAYFNMTKLGADARVYYRNFYGHMNDSINAGEESDRLYVEWMLGSDKAVAASRDGGQEPDFPARAPGPVIVLDEDNRGQPVIQPANGSAVVLSRVPRDIVALRSRTPELAREWRRAQRESLGGTIDAGYHVAGVTKSGWYVLTNDS